MLGRQKESSVPGSATGVYITIVIDHGQGVFSLYSHLHRIDVSKGELVNKGQIIGGIGTTGQSTGPHLHWGMRVNGVYVDPSEWTERDLIY